MKELERVGFVSHIKYLNELNVQKEEIEALKAGKCTAHEAIASCMRRQHPKTDKWCKETYKWRQAEKKSEAKARAQKLGHERYRPT